MLNPLIFGTRKSIKVTISLGVATFPDHASVKSFLIKKADIALYACKDSGRNCSLVYDDSFAEKTE
jgi:diguanylate cyclase (GGDEF)-like protein